MDYSTYTVEQLEHMLDAVVNDYANGDMHHSLYTIEFNELFDAIAEKKRPKQDAEAAYKRAMQGVF